MGRRACGKASLGKKKEIIKTDRRVRKGRRRLTMGWGKGVHKSGGGANIVRGHEKKTMQQKIWRIHAHGVTMQTINLWDSGESPSLKDRQQAHNPLDWEKQKMSTGGGSACGGGD